MVPDLFGESGIDRVEMFTGGIIANAGQNSQEYLIYCTFMLTQHISHLYILLNFVLFFWVK